MAAWFSHPLAEWRRSIDAVQCGARTLPGPQLVQEMDMLRQISLGAPEDLAARLLFKVYEVEQARRADPLLQFDAELDQVLERLERTTNEADRRRATDIGRQLYALGGVEALRAAYDRMTFNQKSAPLREHILQNRWSGLGQWRTAA